jgi:hypothetical protein
MQAILAGASVTPVHTLTLTPELNFSSTPPTWSFCLLFLQACKENFCKDVCVALQTGQAFCNG